MLRLAYSTILLQEVPDEISLGLVFTGCNIKCPNCHSKEYWEKIGNEFDLQKMINEYKNLITCVCFMGGDWEEDSLIDLFHIAKCNGLKVCLYTGIEDFKSCNKFIMYLDYLKVGPYKKELGGLRCKNTNQKFYKSVDSGWIDITSTFEVK